MKLPLTIFSLSITIKNKYVFLNSNSCVSVTIQNETLVLVKFSPTITYCVISQGIYFSS